METQKTIAKWAEDTFGPAHNPAVLVKRADIELQELLEAVEAQDITEIGKETADVIILLLRILEQHGLNFEEEITNKMHENRKRNWLPKGDGTGKHIKP